MILDSRWSLAKNKPDCTHKQLWDHSKLITSLDNKNSIFSSPVLPNKLLMIMASSGYMAPEYLYRGEISTKSDIYSLGVLILETTTREENYRGSEPSAGQFIKKVTGFFFNNLDT